MLLNFNKTKKRWYRNSRKSKVFTFWIIIMVMEQDKVRNWILSVTYNTHMPQLTYDTLDRPFYDCPLHEHIRKSISRLNYKFDLDDRSNHHCNCLNGGIIVGIFNGFRRLVPWIDSLTLNGINPKDGSENFPVTIL